MTSEDPYPPAQPPADGERTGPVPSPPAPVRFSASASVPPPPGQSAVTPQYGGTPAVGQPMPHEYGQPAPFGQQGPAPTGGGGYSSTGAGGPPTGQSRVSATASAPVPPGAPSTSGGHAGQGGSGAGGVPAGHPATYGAPQGFPTQPATQGFPTQSGTYGQPAGAQFGGYGGSGQPASPGGFGQPPGPGFGQPGPSMGQPGGYPPHGYPPGPEPTRVGPPVPSGGWARVDQPAPNRRRRGVLIALIAVASLIVVGGVGGIAWALANRSTPYQVGVCVQQDGTSARVVDCGTSGAFRITTIVDSESQCPDPAKPALVLTGAGQGRQVACLTEATSP